MNGATRLQSLIIGLLEYSRVSTHGKPFSKIDIGLILDNVMKDLEVQIRETDATVTYSDMPVIPADEAQMTGLFQNLLQNAIKFRQTDTKPRIDITCVQDGPYYSFRVHDNGIGIEPQYFDRIFVIFQRLHSREEYPGTGIGLALCKRIVERHGGTIRIESIPGKGSSFHFTIAGALL